MSGMSFQQRMQLVDAVSGESATDCCAAAMPCNASTSLVTCNTIAVTADVHGGLVITYLRKLYTSAGLCLSATHRSLRTPCSYPVLHQAHRSLRMHAQVGHGRTMHGLRDGALAIQASVVMLVRFKCLTWSLWKLRLCLQPRHAA